MSAKEIIHYLPYREPFLFVDELTEVSEQLVEGLYTFKESAFFYRGHFKDNPITPGVILTETMAQIGVVCLGIYLLRDQVLNDGFPKIAFRSAVDCLAMVLCILFAALATLLMGL
jgi:3-hydroxyacyl-[acyl-carrier-protein] dehydratase